MGLLDALTDPEYYRAIRDRLAGLPSAAALNGSSRVSSEFDRPTVEAVMQFLRDNMKREAFIK